MSDLKLFRISNGKAEELFGASMTLEKSLQTLIEHNMETLFGVRLLASEYSTGKKHAGRMDSLGIDEDGSPVIFEYKRATNENVINQGLFYLDWLMDHRAEFKLLVMETLGAPAAEQIDWRNPRLVCVAGNFTNYDEHAVRQINRNIALFRYRDFGGELLALDLITSVTGTTIDDEVVHAAPTPKKAPGAEKTVTQLLDQADQRLKDLYAELEATLVALGDDVERKVLKFYFGFRRIKNFACVEVHPKAGDLLVYLKVNPDTVDLEPGFTRDVRKIGHFGTGELEVRLTGREHLTRALPLIQRSYDAS